MIITIIVIYLFTFILFLLQNQKKATIYYLYTLPFLHPNIALINIKGLPLVSLNRVVIFLLIFSFFYNYYTKNNFKDKLKNFPFKYSLIFLGLSLLIVTLFGRMSVISSFFNYLSILNENLLLILIIWGTFDTTVEIKKVFRVICLSFFLISIYGIFTKIFETNPFLDMISLQGYRNIVFSYENIVRGGIYGRTQSVFYHPISYGGHLAMILPFSIWLYLVSNKVKYKLFYLFISFLIVINILLTNSRSPIIFVLIALISLFFSKKIKYVLLVFILIIGSITYIVNHDNYYSNYISTIVGALFFWGDKYNSQLGGSSIVSREATLYAAISYFIEHPLTGFGLTKLREISRFGMDNDLVDAPGFIFELLIDTGILGILAYLIFFSDILRKSFKYKNETLNDDTKLLMSLTFTMTIGYLVFINLTGEMNTFIFFFVLTGLTFKYYYLDINEKYQN